MPWGEWKGMILISRWQSPGGSGTYSGGVIRHTCTLALVYGDQYGTEDKPEANPNIPGSANKKGVWYTNVPGGVKKMVNEDKDYYKLIVTGYNGDTKTGEVEFYLCTRKGDPNHPDWSLVINDWYKVDLSSLGVVSKVVFHVASSDIEEGTGRMRTPPYFCLDGIRIKN